MRGPATGVARSARASARTVEFFFQACVHRDFPVDALCQSCFPARLSDQGSGVSFSSSSMSSASSSVR
eukprot:11212210-Lingulodinium_polyedra.AAC.1